MKTKAATIEPWNKEVHEEMRAFDIPQYWLLITPLECHALLEGIVPTRVKNACAGLKPEVLRDYPEQPIGAER